MKRIGNLYDQICSVENLMLADKKARKKKHNTMGVKIHDRRRGCNILTLHNTLMEGEYKTSEYKIDTIYEPKEREIYKLNYFPDRITHHAIMNYMEAIWVNIFTANTYACIKGRGVHSAIKKLRTDIRKDKEGTEFCLQIDVTKFYPTMDHEILLEILKKKIKDVRLLALLEEIIRSIGDIGVPIGNYLSQYFANLYLAYFDHWLKEKMGVNYYYRYADDIVVLSDSKLYLHNLLKEMRVYLDGLKLAIKGNYRVFPTKTGLDFLGYVTFPDYILLRKRNKKSMARAVAKLIKKQRNISFQEDPEISISDLSGHYGWAKHCDSKHLLKKLLKTA